MNSTVKSEPFLDQVDEDFNIESYLAIAVAALVVVVLALCLCVFYYYRISRTMTLNRTTSTPATRQSIPTETTIQAPVKEEKNGKKKTRKK